MCKITEGQVCIRCNRYEEGTSHKGKITGYLCGDCVDELNTKYVEMNENGIYLTEKGVCTGGE